ncbi:MAG: NlpC/P60 family protein [Actinomycetaceae bacterium]|nr:NlpC/P60 family protein [Actinomycetaceae bacterium]
MIRNHAISSPRMRRTRWAVTVVCLALCTPIAALATPGEDTFQPRDDYERMSMAQIEVELARVRSASDEAEINMRKIGEDVARAHDKLQEAQETSRVATEAAKKSRQNYEAAREKLSSLAQTIYRGGGSALDNFAPFLQSQGIEDVDRRARIVEKFSREADQKMQEVSALDHAANALEEQAQNAEKEVEAAAKEVEQQAATAKEALEAARNEVNAAQERRSALIAQLAQRRRVTEAEEEARQARLEAEATARREAAERARIAASGSNVNTAESQRQAELAARENAASREEERRQQEAAERAAAEAAEAERQAAADAARKAAEEAARQEAAANAAASGAGLAALNWAKGRLGAPYVWGGTGPGYDCSGLVYMAFASAGVSLPRTADDQYWATKRVSIENLQPGDLVFRGEGGSPNAIYHVAIYAGNGQVLESTTWPENAVQYNPLRYYNLVPYGGRV